MIWTTMVVLAMMTTISFRITTTGTSRFTTHLRLVSSREFAHCPHRCQSRHPPEQQMLWYLLLWMLSHAIAEEVQEQEQDGDDDHSDDENHDELNPAQAAFAAANGSTTIKIGCPKGYNLNLEKHAVGAYCEGSQYLSTGIEKGGIFPNKHHLLVHFDTTAEALAFTNQA